MAFNFFNKGRLERSKALGDRLPPGQYQTEKWPVLHYGSVPAFNPETWDFTVSGLVENPIHLTYAQFRELPTVTVKTDIHCVTRWSMFDHEWTGVAFRDIMQLVRPRPEAQFVMALAERHRLPLVTLVDTPGAYPGVAAEQHGQGGAIARSQATLVRLGVPTVSVVIGEGGSGGAVAIAVADRVLMQENAIYSVISPEGCASILWKNAEMAPEAAETLGITSARLKQLGLVDKIISEPLGGAHRDHAVAAQNLKKALQDALRSLADKSPSELVEARFERLMGHGKFKEAAVK